VSRPRENLPQLGALELAVLEYLWTVDDADVLQAHQRIGKARGITSNTIGSALERLHRKGLLVREKVSHAFRYRAGLNRDTFAARRMFEAAGGSRLLADAGLLSAFVSLVADEDESSLDRLEALIAKKRAERGQE
jgi:predicted transcriptional regulator